MANESQSLDPSTAELLDRLKRYLGDRYADYQPLGAGGMGVVFRARNTAVDGLRALKALRIESAVSDDTIGRFRNEAKTLERLAHPNICRVFDCEISREQGVSCIVMEYVKGESLRQLLCRTGRLSAVQTTAIARDLLEALAHAHAHAIVHRDIKPSNIMIRPSGSACLVDFGLGKDLNQPDTTKDHSIRGTPWYMSPEQFQTPEAIGGPLDGRSDLNSLGLVLAECLSGEPVYSERNIARLASQKIHAPAPVPDGALAGAPAHLRHLISGTTARSRDERPRTAIDALHILDASPLATTSRASTATAPRMHHRAARMRAVAAWAIGLATFVAAVGLFGTQWRIFNGSEHDAASRADSLRGVLPVFAESSRGEDRQSGDDDKLVTVSRLPISPAEISKPGSTLDSPAPADDPRASVVVPREGIMRVLVKVDGLTTGRGARIFIDGENTGRYTPWEGHLPVTEGDSVVISLKSAEMRFLEDSVVVAASPDSYGTAVFHVRLFGE